MNWILSNIDAYPFKDELEARQQIENAVQDAREAGSQKEHHLCMEWAVSGMSKLTTAEFLRCWQMDIDNQRAVIKEIREHLYLNGN
jgi:hypothetical protein